MNFPTNCPFCDKPILKDYFTSRCDVCYTKPNKFGSKHYKYYIENYQGNGIDNICYLGFDDLTIILNFTKNIIKIMDVINYKLIFEINSIIDIDLSSKEDILNKINLIMTFI